MIRLLIILIICNIVIANVNEDNKFIDLLPEKEKRAFLDRIARRILEKVQGKNSPNASRIEVSDEQLDAQTAFVQEILREESENIKKRRRYSKNNRRTDKEDVKPVTEITSDTDKQERHIDLTLRNGEKRIKKQTEVVPLPEVDSTSDSSYQTILVETIYDSYNNNNSLQKIREINDLTTSSNTPDRALNSEDNLGAQFSNATGTTQIKPQKELGYNTRLGSTAIPDFDSDLNEWLFKRTTPSTTTQRTNVSTTTTETWDSTRVIYDTPDSSQERFQKKTNFSTNKEKNLREHFTTLIQLVTTESVNANINSTAMEGSDEYTLSTQTEQSEEITTLKNNADIESTAAVESDSDVNLSDHVSKQITVSSTSVNNGAANIQINDASNEKLKSKSVINFKANSNEKITSTSEPSNMEALYGHTYVTRKLSSTKYSEEDINKDLKYILRNYTKSEVLSERTKNVTEDDRETRRNTSETETNSKTDQNNNGRLKFLSSKDKKQTLRTTSNQKVHEVYEIDPQTLPFIERNPSQVVNNKPTIEQNIEQSYYVPVYNYDPSNAYYNPYTRFGPRRGSSQEQMIQNIIAEKSILNDDRSLDESKLNINSWFGTGNNGKIIRKHPQTTLYHKNLLPDLLKLPKQKYNTVYFNLNDYTDYYSGRSLNTQKKFKRENNFIPNSNEDIHPFNNLHNSVNIRDHIRAVRYLLFLRQRFGYIPPLNEIYPKKRKSTTRVTTLSRNYTSQDNDTDGILLPVGHRDNDNKVKLKKKKRNNKNSPIAMDYYFGRQRSEEMSEEWNSIELLKINPLTPTPIYKRHTKKNRLSTKMRRPEAYNNNNVVNKQLVSVLQDLIRMDNDGLLNYPWLKSTVDIRVGIYKILDLINQFHYDSYIHPKDLELLKYVFYLYKYTQLMIVKEDDPTYTYLRKKSWLPKTKKKQRIKQPWKLMRDVYSFLRDSEEDQPFLILHELQDFINEVLFHLNMFHNTIKKIAVTKTYKTQNLYYDLKRNFLKNASKRQLKQVLLHLSMYRIVQMIESNAKSIVKKGFKNYVRDNRAVVDNTKSEFVFVMKLLEELSNFNT